MTRDKLISEQRVAFEAGDAEQWHEFVRSDELLDAFDEYERQDWQRWLNDHPMPEVTKRLTVSA